MIVEFDSIKRAKTRLERGLDFADAPLLFAGLHFSAPTDRKEYDEPRFLTVGTLHGRSVFAVDMTPAGLSVHTAFLTDQNQIIEMPAMFPDVHYALAQIDELRRLVMERFAQAAQIGAQVMAAQAVQAAEQKNI